MEEQPPISSKQLIIPPLPTSSLQDPLGQSEEEKKEITRLSQLQPRKILFSEHFIDNNAERLNTVLDETF